MVYSYTKHICLFSETRHCLIYIIFLNFPSTVDGPQQEGSWPASLWETDENDLLRPVRGGWGPEHHQTSDWEEPGVWCGFGSGLQRGGGSDSRRGWEEGDGVSMNPRPCFPFLRPTHRAKDAWHWIPARVSTRQCHWIHVTLCGNSLPLPSSPLVSFSQGPPPDWLKKGGVLSSSLPECSHMRLSK